MSASATSRVSLPDHINSYPQFSEKASRINALSSFEEVGLEADALVSEYDLSIADAKRNAPPGKKELSCLKKTNLMQVSVVLLWHRVVNLAASLILGEEFGRNTRQFKLASKKVVKLQDKIALDARLTANIPQIISSALMPVIKADSAALAYAVERTSILPIEHLQKLDTFLFDFKEQITNLADFLRSKGSLPPELEPMISQFNDQLLVMRFSPFELEEETSETPPSRFRVIPAAARSCISYLSNLSLVQRLSRSLFKRSIPVPQRSLQPPYIESFLGDRRVKFECREPIHFRVLQDFEKLSEQPLGRELIKRVLSLHSEDRQFLAHEVYAEGACCFARHRVVHLHAHKPMLVTVKKLDGEEDWGENFSFCTLAHELIHHLHYLENSDKYNRMVGNKKDLPKSNYDNREEYYTITGRDLEEELDGHFRVHKFSENLIRIAFGLLERTSHRGSYFTLVDPVNEKMEWVTYLIKAGINGLVGTLRTLLEQRPPVQLLNTKNKYGYTALHFFIENQKIEGVRLLVEAGSNPTIQTKPKNQTEEDTENELRFCENCLHLGVRTKNLEIVELILSSSLLRSPEQMQRFITAKNEDGDTPMHLAAEKGAKDICEVLLRSERSYSRRKEMISVQNNAGLSPLHVSVKEKKPAITELFVRNFASLNVQTVRGRTPLHFAGILNLTEDIRLIARWAWRHDRQVIDREDQDGRTALFWAVNHKNPEAVAILRGCGADSSKGSKSSLAQAQEIEDHELRVKITELLKSSVGGEYDPFNHPEIEVLDYPNDDDED